MIPTVPARVALTQSLYWDREKPILATTCLATLIGRQGRQHDITVRRLHRCIDQIAILERWRESPNEGRSAMISPLPVRGVAACQIMLNPLGKNA